jgi:hypothetical protein
MSELIAKNAAFDSKLFLIFAIVAPVALAAAAFPGWSDILVVVAIAIVAGLRSVGST